MYQIWITTKNIWKSKTCNCNCGHALKQDSYVSHYQMVRIGPLCSSHGTSRERSKGLAKLTSTCLTNNSKVALFSLKNITPEPLARRRHHPLPTQVSAVDGTFSIIISLRSKPETVQTHIGVAAGSYSFLVKISPVHTRHQYLHLLD